MRAPYLRCPRSHRCPRSPGSQRPFQELTGLGCRSKSTALQRALTDFGAEQSFGQASRQLREHYGVELHRSSVREVVLRQAERAAGLVERAEGEAVASYEDQPGLRDGEPWLIVESDGSMVRTGELEPDPAGESTPQGRPKRIRKTRWRETRLSLVEALGGKGRRYAAVLGPPARVGEQLFALALDCGYGDNTRVHGVGDGAPWIAQQVAAVFPRQRFLLDRYHLLEHLHAGASALPEDGGSAQAWVSEQVERIDRGQGAAVVAECRSWGEGALDRLAGYLEERDGQLDYAAARKEGLPLGSGAVEGGHRSVIQARMKLPGAWWKEETVNPMLALRTLRANDEWETFWL